MARRLERSFSFDDDDESSLDPSRQHHQYQDLQPSAPLPYTDSPTRRNDDSPPPPPAHRSNAFPTPRLPPLNTRPVDGYGNGDLGPSTSVRTASTTTPGADNMGESAPGGGIAGVALGVANTNQRVSGLEALHEVEDLQNFSPRGLPPERGYDTVGTDTPYIPNPPSPSHRISQGQDPFSSPAPSRRSNPFDDDRRGSSTPSPGDLTPRANQSSASIPLSEFAPRDPYANDRTPYTDNPYQRYSTAWDPRVAQGDIDPDEIEDDGEDVMAPPVPQRRSVIGLNTRSHNSLPEGAAVGGAAAGGILGTLGGLVGAKSNGVNGTRDASGQYGPVGGPPVEEDAVEKSDWLSKQTSGRKRLRWIVAGVGILVIIAAVVGGVVGGLHHSDSSSGTPGPSAPKDSDTDLDQNSAEIKALMGNPKLHKVFPGMDYTPFNAQYPACLTNPPSQNNITMDVAVLSQLTNTIRLYGTDCNQTEMVLHALDKLALPDIKIWLGVWLDGNDTTNARGLDAMYDILSKNGEDPFAGVIVGNEVLFRKDMTETQLSSVLGDVKKNFTSLKYTLPVATSDLGDDWTKDLTTNVDYVMSNIHPFFAGVAADVGAGWTWDFWQGHDTILTKDTALKNVISETGWPSGGGTDCGTGATSPCANGSVAGVEEMNTFMGDFVCQSLANGTNYFWFEAFDEPWKISLNKPGKEWEDKWGLMDPGRNLKPGLKIPDCGGKTVGS